MKLTIVFMLLVLSLSGCGVFKHSTIYRTKVITQIDTVLKINIEGYKPLTTSKPINDTVILETKTGTAISYIDPIKAKIILSFMPKTFDVPIIINQTKKETFKETEPVSKLILKALLVFLSFVMFSIVYVFWRINILVNKFTK